jgi:hypothetical protein
VDIISLRLRVVSSQAVCKMIVTIRPEILRALERLSQYGERQAAEAVKAYLQEQAEHADGIGAVTGCMTPAEQAVFQTD